MLDGSIWVREDLKWDETTQNGKGNRLLFSDFRSDDYQICLNPTLEVCGSDSVLTERAELKE